MKQWGWVKWVDQRHVLEVNPIRFAHRLGSEGGERGRQGIRHELYVLVCSLDRNWRHWLRWKHRQRNRFEEECRIGVGNHESVLGTRSLSETPRGDVESALTQWSWNSQRSENKARTKYSENTYFHLHGGPCKNFLIFLNIPSQKPSLQPSNFKGKKQTGKFLYSDLRKAPRQHDTMIALSTKLVLDAFVCQVTVGCQARSDS